MITTHFAEPFEVASVGLHRVVGHAAFGHHVVAKRGDVGLQFGEGHVELSTSEDCPQVVTE